MQYIAQYSRPGRPDPDVPQLPWETDHIYRGGYPVYPGGSYPSYGDSQQPGWQRAAQASADLHSNRAILLSPRDPPGDPSSRPQRRHHDSSHDRRDRPVHRHSPEYPQPYPPRVQEAPKPVQRYDPQALVPGAQVSLADQRRDQPPSRKRRRNEESQEKPNPKVPNASDAVSQSSLIVSSPSTEPSQLGSTLGDRQYQYRALTSTEFRLVRVHPERKTMIKCEIFHASLEEPPVYIAISYAWGDAGDTRKIELNGSNISISVSLHGALRAVRQKSRSVLVWADALCIDQQNWVERSQQVQMMTSIYSLATSVAIWLGQKGGDTVSALKLLQEVTEKSPSTDQVSQLISAGAEDGSLAGIVSLFEREYWDRLWVVQEIFNAKSATVYCGSTKLPWDIYQRSCEAFSRHRNDLEKCNLDRRAKRQTLAFSPNGFSYVQVLIYHGPASIPRFGSLNGRAEEALLDVLCRCRRKLASDPRDKLFGILGILPESIRQDFRADYNLSVKDVFTEIVDYLIKTTERLDVICESLHFPVHFSSTRLPSFVPDWSYISTATSLIREHKFSAAGDTKAQCRFLDERLNKLEITAVPLDIVRNCGNKVSTSCTLSDYLMAFLHWRAVLLDCTKDEKPSYQTQVQEEFARTLSLGQIPPAWKKPGDWLIACYHVFATLLRQRLPHLPLDMSLQGYTFSKVDIEPDACRQFLQKNFGNPMMGRCFCFTQERRLGMGSGSMMPGDIVVIPLGCSTPVILREDGNLGEYLFVGDVYIDRYMDGYAMKQMKEGKREAKKYILH